MCYWVSLFLHPVIAWHVHKHPEVQTELQREIFFMRRRLQISMPVCNWVIWEVLCRMNSPSIRGIIIAHAIKCYFQKQLVHKMFPSSVILTGAGSTLDLQADEPLKPESRLLKRLTRYKIIFQLHRKWPKLSQMNTCSVLHSSYINWYTASTLYTYRNIGQEACPYSVHTENVS